MNSFEDISKKSWQTEGYKQALDDFERLINRISAITLPSEQRIVKELKQQFYELKKSNYIGTQTVEEAIEGEVIKEARRVK